MLSFKPFEYTDQEYRVFSEIWNAYYPDEVYAPDELRHEDDLRDPKYIFQRFVVEGNDGIIGFCAYRETPFEYEPGKLHLAIYLDRDHLGFSNQNALYNFLIEQVAQHNPTKLVSMAREDKPEGSIFIWIMVLNKLCVRRAHVSMYRISISIATLP